MKKHGLHQFAQILTPVGVGFLGFLVFEGFLEHQREGILFSFDTTILVVFILAGIFFGQRLAKHIACKCDHGHSHDSHGEGESEKEREIDFWFLVSVSLAGIFHTTIDGAVLGSVAGEGKIFLFILLPILLHEVIRISTLLVSIRDMGYSKFASFLSVPFSTIVGLSLGIFLENSFSHILESNGELIHMLSAGLYSLVITDIFLWIKNRFGISKTTVFLIVLGFLVAMALSVPHSI
jgi:predicted Na+-dependent transporter